MIEHDNDQLVSAIKALIKENIMFINQLQKINTKITIKDTSKFKILLETLIEFETKEVIPKIETIIQRKQVGYPFCYFLYH